MNITDKEKKELVSKFIDAVSNHDVYYEMSDDHRVWQSGLYEQQEILQMEKEIAEMNLSFEARVALIPTWHLKGLKNKNDSFNPFPSLYSNLFTKEEMQSLKQE